MHKSIIEFTVTDNERMGEMYSLMRVSPANGSEIPECMPGQFVQVSIDNSKTTFLRRPISICYVDRSDNTLWLLVRKAGAGTSALTECGTGTVINIIFPLGKGFTMPSDNDKSQRLLLVGGGVGVAPLLGLAASLKSAGFEPDILLGARSGKDVLLRDKFNCFGRVYVATDDGSEGHHGVVTMHPLMDNHYDMIYCCGPAPMMKAVAVKSKQTDSPCEVSLDNMMACGVGACLCCVEKTVRGNVCVCTEGPVFNISELTW